MSNDLDQKLWLTQETAFNDFKSGQPNSELQNEERQAYYHLYQLLDDAEVGKFEPDQSLGSIVSRKLKRQKQAQKVKALTAWLVIAMLSAASLITFFAVANKSVLLGSVVDAAPWVLMAVTITAIVITALGFNKILIRRR